MSYQPPSMRRRVGLGDAVQTVLKPFVMAVDAVAGTNLKNCKSCHGKGGRKEKLNKIQIPLP